MRSHALQMLLIKQDTPELTEMRLKPTYSNECSRISKSFIAGHSRDNGVLWVSYGKIRCQSDAE
jgi:hypothetical protein